MVTKELTVINDSGIHARPAALIVETATKFKSNVIFIKKGIRANAKSIMNIMLLAAKPASMIHVEKEGSDESAASKAIEALIQSHFKYRGHSSMPGSKSQLLVLSSDPASTGF